MARVFGEIRWEDVFGMVCGVARERKCSRARGSMEKMQKRIGGHLAELEHVCHCQQSQPGFEMSRPGLRVWYPVRGMLIKGGWQRKHCDTREICDDAELKSEFDRTSEVAVAIGELISNTCDSI